MSLPNPRIDDVALEYSDLIDRAVADFGDHVGLTRPKVIRWLAQFPDAAISAGAKAPGEVDYVASSNIQRMSQQLAAMVYGQYPTVDRNSIYFVPIGLPASASHVVARSLRISGVRNDRIVDLLTLIHLPPDEVEVIVFIDDFSGTGKAIKDWWRLNEPIILPINAANVSGVLVLNHCASEPLDELFEKVLYVKFLDESSDIFHPSCGAFDDAEKDHLLD